MIRRPEEESIALHTLYSKTYFSRVCSQFHEAYLGLCVCASCIFGFVMLRRSCVFVVVDPHARMIEQSKDTVYCLYLDHSLSHEFNDHDAEDLCCLFRTLSSPICLAYACTEPCSKAFRRIFL